MTRDEIVEDVMLELGAPVVELENEEVIGKLVDKAFREVSRYITETRYFTMPYTTAATDISKYNVNTVVMILRTANPSRVNDFTDIYSLSTLNTANSSSTNLLLSDYLYRTQMNQLKSTITTDLDFTYDKEDKVLYINTFYPRPDKVTVVYIPEFKDVSEVKEMYWINYIQRLSVAYCKMSLGRIRGKYDLSSSLYKLDGNQLVQEGIQERDTIRQELTENSDLVFPID